MRIPELARMPQALDSEGGFRVRSNINVDRRDQRRDRIIQSRARGN